MKVVIMAGGKGTRITSVRADVPKPMIELCGIPILEHQLNCLSRQGITDVTIVVGHLGHVVTTYFGDKYKYIKESEPLGTAGALYYLKDIIKEDFALINGDILFDVDLNKAMEEHKKNNCIATIIVHPNDHPYDSGVIQCDKNSKVINWFTKEDKRPKWYDNLTNAGVHLLSPKIFESFTEAVKTDLDRQILKMLIGKGELFAYRSSEYIHDVGTPERLSQAEKDLQSGLVASKNLSNKQKAIFIDRDGTINKTVPFLNQIDDFELIDGVANVIRQINKSSYLAICVTNQPVIARGELTFDGLDEIHRKMETLLGEQGAYLDDIFYCPHHPDKDFDGEVSSLKMMCSCRKPNIGMFLSAAEKYNIDLSQSIMIGDSSSDKMAAENAKCAKYFESLKVYADYLEGK